MEEVKMSRCIRYGTKIYAVTMEGQPVTVTLSEIEMDELPVCVIKAFLKDAACKKRRRADD